MATLQTLKQNAIVRQQQMMQKLNDTYCNYVDELLKSKVCIMFKIEEIYRERIDHLLNMQKKIINSKQKQFYQLLEHIDHEIMENAISKQSANNVQRSECDHIEIISVHSKDIDNAQIATADEPNENGAILNDENTEYTTVNDLYSGLPHNRGQSILDESGNNFEANASNHNIENVESIDQDSIKCAVCSKLLASNFAITLHFDEHVTEKCAVCNIEYGASLDEKQQNGECYEKHRIVLEHMSNNPKYTTINQSGSEKQSLALSNDEASISTVVSSLNTNQSEADSLQLFTDDDIDRQISILQQGINEKDTEFDQILNEIVPTELQESTSTLNESANDAVIVKQETTDATVPCLEEIESAKNENKEKDDIDPLYCPVCDLKFKSKKNFIKDIEFHFAQRCVECNDFHIHISTKGYHRCFKTHQIISDRYKKAIKCKNCSFATLNKERLDQHIKQCNKTDIFLIETGSKSIPKHVQKTKTVSIQPINSKPLTCDICPKLKPFSSESLLLLHVDRHIRQCCQVCNIEFGAKLSDEQKNEKCYAKHEKIANYMKNAKNIYECHVCPYKTMIENNYDQHHLKHLPDSPNDAALSSANCLRRGFFKKSRSSSNQTDKSYVCEDCDRQFDSASALDGHRRTHSSKNKSSNGAYKYKTCDGKFTCPHCGKKVKSAQALTTHIRWHTNERPYKCPECDKKFCTTTDRLNHVRCVHENERKYQCHECEKAFNSSHNLKVHMYVHTGEKPFKCKYCGESFNTSSKKCRHERNKHIGWKCPFCEKKFNSESQLKNHRSAMHPNEKRRANEGTKWFDFGCEKCDRRFKTNEEADAHYIECNGSGEEMNELDELRGNDEGIDDHNEVLSPSITNAKCVDIDKVKQKTENIETEQNNEKKILINTVTHKKKRKKKKAKQKKDGDEIYVPHTIGNVNGKRRKSKRLDERKKRRLDVNASSNNTQPSPKKRRIRLSFSKRKKAPSCTK